MSTPPVPRDFAGQRRQRIAPLVIPPACTALPRAWTRTQATLLAMQRRLEDQLPLAAQPPVASIAVSGSLGRMEQVSQSDCDLIVILRDEVDPHSRVARRAYEQVWAVLEPLQLNRPRSHGIYANPATQAQLVDPDSLGRIDESPALFGKRIQLLLDCQPVYNAGAYERLVAAIVERYAAGRLQVANRGDWEFLINDLIRYFRSLQVYYRWNALQQPLRWRLRNLKGRHSRLILYCGLLLLLGECSSVSSAKPDWLTDKLKLTPLERIAWVYARHGDENFLRIAACYDRFLSRLGDESFRRQLAGPPGDSVGQPDRNPQFLELWRNSVLLASELMRFQAQRAGQWHPSFYDCLFY